MSAVIVTILTCRQHPRYLAKRIPRNNCVPCYEVWAAVQHVKRLEKWLQPAKVSESNASESNDVTQVNSVRTGGDN